MKKLLLIVGIIILITSMSMCITHKNLDDLRDEVVISVNGTPVKIPLRATIGEAKEVKLINTTDKEIYSYYNSKRLIYVKGDMDIMPEEGGVAIIDLISKLEWFNQLYPHDLFVELDRDNSTVTVKSVLANGKILTAKLKINESEYLMHNNKTMVIEILKTHNNATITKINNTFIIEGNSLKEMDKAETRFVIAMFKGSVD
jgi:hypothetical protein